MILCQQKNLRNRYTMSRLGNFRVPPISATLNVAWQTLKQHIPEKSSNTETPGEKSHFAQTNHTNHGTQGEHHELSNMVGNQSTNPFLSGQVNAQIEDTGFNQGYSTMGRMSSTRGQSMSSMDMSEDDFVEGRSEIKINEYQAAWNVTNAIQVCNS